MESLKRFKSFINIAAIIILIIFYVNGEHGDVVSIIKDIVPIIISVGFIHISITVDAYGILTYAAPKVAYTLGYFHNSTALQRAVEQFDVRPIPMTIFAVISVINFFINIVVVPYKDILELFNKSTYSKTETYCSEGNYSLYNTNYDHDYDYEDFSDYNYEEETDLEPELSGYMRNSLINKQQSLEICEDDYSFDSDSNDFLSELTINKFHNL